MTDRDSYSLYKKKYAQISTKKRQILVQMVLQQGKSLSQAGRRVKVNPSTVRLIIKKFKQTGGYFMKKLKNSPKNDINNTNLTKQAQNPISIIQQDKNNQNNIQVKQQVNQLYFTCPITTFVCYPYFLTPSCF